MDVVKGSYILIHVCPYRNVWPEVVLQELQNCLDVIIIRDVGFYHFTKFCCSIPTGF